MGKRKRTLKICNCKDCGISTSGYGLRCLRCARKYRETIKKFGAPC